MPNATTAGGDWLSPAQVKLEFGLGLELLKEHRSRGTGPAHVRAGYRTLRYHRADVAEWMADHRATVVPVASAMLNAIRAASERLGAVEAAAQSLALLTPGGVVNEPARALARDLSRELVTLLMIGSEGCVS